MPPAPAPPAGRGRDTATSLNDSLSSVSSLEMVSRELADSAIVIQGRLKTKPIRQWDVGREFLRRIKLGFRYDNRKAATFVRDQGGIPLGTPLAALGEEGALINPQLSRRLQYMPDANALWFARSEMVAVLSRIHGEAKAVDIVQELSPSFRGLLPRSLMDAGRMRR